MRKIIITLALALVLAIPAYAAAQKSDGSIYPAYGSVHPKAPEQTEQSAPTEKKESRKANKKAGVQDKKDQSAEKTVAPAGQKRLSEKKARSGRRFEKSGPQAGPRTTAPAKTTVPAKTAAPGKAPAPGKGAAPGKAPAPGKGAEAPKVEADYKALAGIYVECPRKNPERCPAARDEFRDVFPNGQPHPYFMIRKDGRGYLAANERFTTNFTIQSYTPDHIVIRLDDQKKTTMDLKRNGEIWRNPKGGSIYVLTVTDAEWNPDPQPFKKIHERGKK